MQDGDSPHRGVLKHYLPAVAAVNHAYGVRQQKVFLVVAAAWKDKPDITIGYLQCYACTIDHIAVLVYGLTYRVRFYPLRRGL